MDKIKVQQAADGWTVSLVVLGEVNAILGCGFTVAFRIGPVTGRSPTRTLPGVSTVRVCEGLQIGDPIPFIGHGVSCRGFIIPALRVLENLLDLSPRRARTRPSDSPLARWGRSDRASGSSLSAPELEVEVAVIW